MASKKRFWKNVARFIINYRVGILLFLILLTYVWTTQFQYLGFSHKEPNLLPDNNIQNINYTNFISQFGDEGNLIVIGVKGEKIFTVEGYSDWENLRKEIESNPEVNSVISIDNLQILTKNKEEKKFEIEQFVKTKPFNLEQLDSIKSNLFSNLPFYKNLIYSADLENIRMIVYLDKQIIDSKKRKTFVLDKLVPLIDQFEEKNHIDAHVSGMPYIRTLNSKNITDEIGLFIFGALFITSFVFFLFFKSFRATFISLCVVIMGVLWSLGIIGGFGFKITILTALIPPLIIVIGIPNCIYLINKYQRDIAKTNNKKKSVTRVIKKVGYATLITNLTTAFGFATFIFTGSEILQEFGILAAINIMVVFILSILIIPILYFIFPNPKSKHLKHIKNKTINKIMKFISEIVKHRRHIVYLTVFVILIASVIGISKITISGNMLDEAPKEEDFFQDILYFDQNFGGIIPIEILIDTKRKNGFTKLSTLSKVNKLDKMLDTIPELSSSLSFINILKYAKQTYYNNNPKYYDLPTRQENSFVSSYFKKENSNSTMLESYVDSTGQFGRFTVFLKDTSTKRIKEILATVKTQTDKIFNPKQYNILVTGKAILFLEGTKYLIDNLILSLSLAIILISIFISIWFRSAKMVFIGLLPNLIPLIITGGIMGFLNIPLKPSTILIFSIAFGISVDDTIHFLAKYKQELISSKYNTIKSLFSALKETGTSMFYTSIVLFAGFLVFTLSQFGGTVALGSLVSTTLLFAMITNLILLPSLILTFNQFFLKKKKIK